MNQNPDKRAALAKNIAARVRQQFGDSIPLKEACKMVGIPAPSLARIVDHLVQDEHIKTEDFAKWIVTGSKRLTHFALNVGDPSVYPSEPGSATGKSIRAGQPGS